jgi:glycosyltransferase 2 family protein
MSGKNTKSIIQFVVLLGIGILLIWLSLKGISDQQRKEIVVAFQTADYLWIIIAMVISLLSHFLRAYRWNYLLQPVGHKTNLLNATCYVLVGYFANYGIPRMGEVSRCTLASKYDKVPFEVAFGTVITERIIDFILFLVIFVLTLALQFTELIGLANKYVFDPALGKLSALSSSPVKLIVFGIIVFAFFGFLFLFRKKIANLLKGKLGGILKGMAEGIGSVRKMENPVKFITLSLMIWACYFYALYFCFFSLPVT